MSITKEFIEAVENGKLLRVRIMLKDILLIDPTATKFGEMESFAGSKLDNLYDEHDDEMLIHDVAGWDQDYLNEQMVAVVNNFSKERIELLKNMVRHIYRDKIQKIRFEESSSKSQKKTPITQKHIGTSGAVSGAALIAAGICTSQPILTIGGVAATTIGVALIVTDREKSAITQKYVGTNIAVSGATLVAAGLCTSNTILTVGGVATTAAGFALIATDKR